MSDETAEPMPVEKELRAQPQVAESALETTRSAWIEHYHSVDAPPSGLGKAHRDAKRVVDVGNPEWIKTALETHILAYAFVQAADRWAEAIRRRKARIAYSPPEQAEDLYQRIRELRGGVHH